MRTILLTLIVVSLIAMNTNAIALTIIKPHESDTYYVGQTLTIELQTLPEEDIEQIYILTKDFEGAILDKPPYIYETVIDKPIDGQVNISVMAILKNKKSIMLTTYIYAKLPTELVLKDIILEEGTAIVIMRPSSSGEDTIRADGIFSDGTQHPINSYSQTTYKCLDETIAKVNSAGVITGVYPGRTTVILSAGNITKEIKVKVKYEIDPIKVITVVSSDKFNEIKWEKSPYEGEVVSGYKIFRSQSEYGIDKIMIGIVQAGTSSFVDGQIEMGAKYYYSVQAFSQKYNSGSSMKQWVTPGVRKRGLRKRGQPLKRENALFKERGLRVRS